MLVALGAAALIFKLAEIQISEPEYFVERGVDQRFRIADLAAGRGEILDRNENTLAISLPGTSYFADPSLIEDPKVAAALLAPLIGRDVEETEERLSGDSRFVWLARLVSPAEAAQLSALDIKGVFPREEAMRYYPAGRSFGRPVIGSVHVDGRGASGLEAVANESLIGKPGKVRVELGVNGSTIPGSPLSIVVPRSGSDVVSTIDRSIQFQAERLLARQISKVGGAGGVIVVSQPATGEVLAMASVSRNDEGELVVPSTNEATGWAFEPGSVMKAMAFAAILDAGVGSTSDTIVVPSRYELFDVEFEDEPHHPPSEWTMKDIVARSSNVGTVMWAERLGRDRLARYLRSFGFGHSQEFGFPGESAGLIVPSNQWGEVATATTALGQGVNVTPAQMLAAYNVIANDGMYVPLQLVREVLGPDGTREIYRSEPTHRVISAETADHITDMLESVVVRGTGVDAGVAGYRVAGKTGTARKVLDDQPGYQDEAGNYRHVATFVGFLPADRPEISILVSIDEPTASIYASYVAAPVFAELAAYAIRKARIAPSGATTPQVQADLGVVSAGSAARQGVEGAMVDGSYQSGQATLAGGRTGSSAELGLSASIEEEAGSVRAEGIGQPSPDPRSTSASPTSPETQDGHLSAAAAEPTESANESESSTSPEVIPQSSSASSPQAEESQDPYAMPEASQFRELDVGG